MGISSCIRRETGTMDFDERTERTKMILDYLSHQVSRQREEKKYPEEYKSNDDSFLSDSLINELRKDKQHQRDDSKTSELEELSFLSDLRDKQPSPVEKKANEPGMRPPYAYDSESLNPGTNEIFLKIKNRPVACQFDTIQEPRIILSHKDPDSIFNLYFKFKANKFIQEVPESHPDPPEIDLKHQKIEHELGYLDNEEDSSIFIASKNHKKRSSSSTHSNLLGNIKNH